ncbi:MAG: hypothetical protein LBG60_15180 [Bifidobacteriaceae bacterium]|jgi:ABC-2 type transport system permease protein|nr:hypothetical protein [Bifidobacteriaceae bacterium]
MSTASASRTRAAAQPRSHRAAPPGTGELAGFGKLVRGIVRRDRLRLAIWLVCVVGVSVASVAAFTDMFETPASAQARAALMATPTGSVFGGPGFGLDNYTAGAMVANEFLLWIDVTVALAAILLMTHMSRAEEEAGRLELVGAAPVGRRAPLAAAFAVVSAEVVVIGLLIGFGCLAYPSLDRLDCLGLGLAVAGTGLAFAGLAALAAQLASTGRGAGALGAAALGVAYLLRAVGDTATLEGESAWASWLSPLGWANRMALFVHSNWWPLALMAAFALLTGAGAWQLAARRDEGAGLLPQRRGRARASRWLRRPVGLVWRLTRASFIGWGLGAVVLALCIAPIMGQIPDYVADNPIMGQAMGVAEGAGADAAITGFSSVMVMFMAALAGALAISVVATLRRDESAGRAALELAEPVSRGRLLAAAWLVACVGGVVVLAVGSGVYAAVLAADPAISAAIFESVVRAGLAYVPAVLALAALTGLLVAALPSWTALIWAVYGFGVLSSWFGGLLGLPEWTRYLSPLSAVDAAPSGLGGWADLAWGNIAAITAVAAAALALGHARFRARDLGG